MCLIIHKPPRTVIPERLIRAARALNQDGWGLMGFDGNGDLLLYREPGGLDELLALERELRGAEYILHLRKRTRGSSERCNLHPFEVGDGLYLMHNGTLSVKTRVPGKSDTWHLSHDVLRPLYARWPGLLMDSAFKSLLEASLAPENKLVLLDYPHRRIVIINRHHGLDYEGLWLSSAKWIDRALLPLNTARPQERSYRLSDVRFL